MGLTSWKGSPEGRIHSSDVTVAKNYLTEDEIARLNRLVTRFLDDLEDRAADHVLTSMRDCADALDGFLRYARRDALEGKGTRTHAQAKKKALGEFAKFQKVQDATFENDFEREMRRIEGRR
ncbi:MAG: virulence RhuM family protein [Eggerthellaceae bacterium]|nr:virulence RhuM family protein [Eggerthellaceae bacterium]